MLRYFGIVVLALIQAIAVGETSNSGLLKELEVEAALFNQERLDNFCRHRFLKYLGWQEEVSSSSYLDVAGGNPCDNDDLSESYREGELTLRLPKDINARTAEDFAKSLSSLESNSATVCAYRMKVSKATHAASQKLAWANRSGTYSFTRSGDPFSGIQPARGWTDSVKTCRIATSSPAAAIECFYNDTCRSECAVGLQVAAMSIQYELYGRHRFDRAFKTKEITIGTWVDVSASDSATECDGVTCQYPGSSDESLYLAQGKHAFIGVRGYIGNIRGESYLDSSADRGENYVIVDMSKLAMEGLRNIGGFRKLRRTNEIIWAGLTNNATARSEYWSSLGLTETFSYARSQKLMNTPVYQDIKVYVHPLGIMSYGEHLSRLAKYNPRTPYTISLYDDRLNTVLYDRYRRFMANECLQGTEF